ncbi:MAG: DUF1684 domain-containing protein [Anaerolineae bacterium]|nr:DUF1684 domain-containing protein [Anaerolineae bacterium]
MLDLLDYRRRVFAMYNHIRETGTSVADSFALFRASRDDLFASHSQSALDAQQKAMFKGLNYYDYNAAYRVLATVNQDIEPVEFALDGGHDGAIKMRQIGQVDFELPLGKGSLGVFWIATYGGGIFIPFRDTTNSDTSYGGGRYLYDTIKGADLGSEGAALVLDFNYAYHPSCYYNALWTCPLAPMQNRLNFRIEAGEQLSVTV